jgi:hypothetical protein
MGEDNVGGEEEGVRERKGDAYRLASSLMSMSA